VCLAHGVIAKGEGIPCPIDDAGRFMDPVADFKGLYVKASVDQVAHLASAPEPGLDPWTGVAGAAECQGQP
jgi:isoleucyl-tRNA synthetase